MGKLDDLRRITAGNVDDSMGVGREARAADSPPGPSAPARWQGVGKSKNAAEIPTEKIAPDPSQPREEFDEESLRRLAASLKSRGQLQPIRVRWDDGGGVYMILCGERRWRAARMAGMTTMTAIVQEGPIAPADLLAIQLVENCLREDLKPIEQARAFQTLVDRNGWTVRQVADELALNHSSVVRALALLDLPASVQARVEEGSLPPSTAYEISKVEDSAERADLAARVVAEGMTRGETVVAVKASRTSAGSKGRGAKAKPRKTTERVIRTAAGYKITIECRRGIEDATAAVALEEAAAQIRGHSRSESQEAA